MPDPTKPRLQCRHLRAAGARCGMAALRDQNFCFYHQASHRPVAKFRYPDAAKEPFTFPVIEDRPSIQLALSQVLGRIASNDLDPKRAGLLLYGLQIAVGALPPEPRPSVARDTVLQGRARIQAILADLRAGRRPREYTAAEEDEILDTLDDLDNLTLDPDLGPLAPQTNMPSPEDEPPTYFDKFMAEFQNPPTPQTSPTPTPAPTPITLPKIQAAAETEPTARLSLTTCRAMRHPTPPPNPEHHDEPHPQPHLQPVSTAGSTHPGSCLIQNHLHRHQRQPTSYRQAERCAADARELHLPRLHSRKRKPASTAPLHSAGASSRSSLGR